MLVFQFGSFFLENEKKKYLRECDAYFPRGCKSGSESYRALVPPCPVLTQRAAGGGGEGWAR